MVLFLAPTFFQVRTRPLLDRSDGSKGSSVSDGDAENESSVSTADLNAVPRSLSNAGANTCAKAGGNAEANADTSAGTIDASGSSSIFNLHTGSDSRSNSNSGAGSGAGSNAGSDDGARTQRKNHS